MQPLHHDIDNMSPSVVSAASTAQSVQAMHLTCLSHVDTFEVDGESLAETWAFSRPQEKYSCKSLERMMHTFRVNGTKQ